MIAESEGESFYRGQLAARIVAHAKAHGGPMTASICGTWGGLRSRSA